MSDTCLDVKVKLHPGGRMSTVENTVINMSLNDTEFICNTDAFVILVCKTISQMVIRVKT